MSCKGQKHFPSTQQNGCLPFHSITICILSFQLYVSNVLECERQYYIVMEYAVNGDLTEFINKKGCLVEADARRLFKQLLNVVSYLHSNNVCHRDIKCDNILLDGQFNLKLAGLFIILLTCIFLIL